MVNLELNVPRKLPKTHEVRVRFEITTLCLPDHWSSRSNHSTTIAIKIIYIKKVEYCRWAWGFIRADTQNLSKALSDLLASMHSIMLLTSVSLICSDTQESQVIPPSPPEKFTSLGPYGRYQSNPILTWRLPPWTWIAMSYLYVFKYASDSGWPEQGKIGHLRVFGMILTRLLL